MRPLVSYIRSLNPELPRSVLTLQLGGLVNFYGSGIAIPFVFIYLHNVRGIGLDTAGLILATVGIVGLIAGPAAGAAVDRVGGRPTLAAALVLQATGYVGYALTTEAWHAFAAAAFVGAGVGVFWPAQSSLIAGLTPADRRPAAFALQRVTMNVGFGLGGLTGGLIASTSEPRTFVALFLVDAATFVAYLGALALVPEPARGDAQETAERGTYRDVLRNRIFVGVVLINVMLIAGGVAQLNAFPVYAKNEAGLSEAAIGVVYFLNTLIVALAQLPIARLLEGRRRMPAIALLAALWAFAWMSFPLIADLAHGGAAAVLFAVAVGVFALGQCLHGAVQAPLVVDLAEARIIGRYLALSSMSWQVGFTVAPALAGLLLAVWPHGLWFVSAAICAAAGVLALATEGRIPAPARRTPARPAVAAAPAAGS